MVLAWHTLSSCTRRQKKQLDTYIQQREVIYRAAAELRGGRTAHHYLSCVVVWCARRRGVRLPAIGRSLGLAACLFTTRCKSNTLSASVLVSEARARSRCVWWQIRARPLILIKRARISLALCKPTPRAGGAVKCDANAIAARKWPQACGFHVRRVWVFCLTYI